MAIIGSLFFVAGAILTLSGHASSGLLLICIGCLFIILSWRKKSNNTRS